MKILQIFNRYLERGGEEIVIERMTPLLRSRHEVNDVFFASEEWTRPGAPGRVRQALRMFWNRDALRVLEAADREFRPDVWIVHNVYPVASAAVYRLARSLGRPVVHYGHNYRPFSVNGYLWDGSRALDPGWPGAYLRETLGGAWQGSRVKTGWFACVLSAARALGWYDHVACWVAISGHVGMCYREAGIDPERIAVLRHFHPVRPWKESGEDAGYFLYLGRLSREKGVAFLLDVWREWGAGAPELVMAGDGPLRGEVEAAARSGGVRRAGRVGPEERDRLIRECRAVVVPSLWAEALGMVVYEAYEWGKPVLAARSGGLTETVEPGVTGWLHSPGSGNELVEQVRQLACDPARAAGMGRAGRSWLEREASPAGWQEAMDRILSDAAGRPAG
jgi:glycosyltransferase involved in cell wall biosynthesis